MPVLEATDERIIPRSALRHRPIGEPGGGKEKTAILQPVAQRASRTQPGESEEIAEWKRIITGEPAPDTRPTTATATKTARLAPKRNRTRLRMTATRQPKSSVHAHPLLYLGLGMTAMLVLWMLLSAVVNWTTLTMDDMRYGRPRTFQTDARVGHNEQNGTPSHFIAINLNRHIQIIEISGGDPAHTRIYSGPQLYGANDDLVPVTLSFQDVNGDHKPDMIVSFQNTRMIYINDQGGFRPQHP